MAESASNSHDPSLTRLAGNGLDDMTHRPHCLPHSLRRRHSPVALYEVCDVPLEVGAITNLL